MTNLTEKESLFLKALKNDYYERGSKSFLATLFISKDINEESGRYLALEKFEMQKNIDFIKKSTIVLMRQNGHLIGKKDDFYFTTCDYREIACLGREIQNLPYYLHYNELSESLEIGEDIKQTEYFNNLPEYLLFCEKYDLKYCTHLSQDFQDDIIIIDKEEVIFEEFLLE